nr:FUSC family protein [Pontibacter silvestris]
MFFEFLNEPTCFPLIVSPGLHVCRYPVFELNLIHLDVMMIKEKSGRALKSLVTLNEGPWRWSVGVQAGIAMGLPIGLCYQSLGLIASLGGFTALYCVSLPRKERMRILPLIAIGLVLVSVLGVLCSVNVWVSLVCLLGVAALACLLTLGAGLGPPGSLMFVLVYSVSGHIAVNSHQRGMALGVATIPMLVATGAILAYLVVLVSLVLPFGRRHKNIPAHHPDSLIRVKLNRETVFITLKVIAGVAVAGLAGIVFGATRSYWIVIPAVAVLQVSHNRRHTTVRAFHRVMGTIVGILFFNFLAEAEPTGMWLVALIMFLQFALEVVVAKNYGLALVFITPLALTISTATKQSSNLAFSVRERAVDTLLGAVIAMIVFWISEIINTRKTNKRKTVEKILKSVYNGYII